MAKVSISEGARLAGVSRSTLNRHLKDGLISKHKDNSGRPYVDTSELLRFYGELSQADRTNSRNAGQHGTDHFSLPVSDLERRVYAAEAASDLERVRRESAEARLAAAEEERANWQAQAERLTLLLTDQRKATAELRRPWWQRVFGGGHDRG